MTAMTKRGSPSRLPPPSLPVAGFQAPDPPESWTRLKLISAVLVPALPIPPLFAQTMLLRSVGLLVFKFKIPP